MPFNAAAFVTDSWYKGAFWLYLLFPLSLIYRVIVAVRRYLYHNEVFSSYQSKLPLVIVGNITVGGSGKSPLVAYLVESLQAKGFTPGVVSRAYGANIGKREVREVLDSSSVSEVGDEPLMLKQRLGCTVVVSPSRVMAVKIVEEKGCDIVIADDGLQHYALERDIEICVFDGERKWGNGRMLPMGPLREPLNRINESDYVVVNGADGEILNCCAEQPDLVIRMDLEIGKLRAVCGIDDRTLADFKECKVHAVAAIGHPERFFSSLESHDLLLERHAFDDHYVFTKNDFNFDDELPIIMTEKDAVKCRDLGLKNAWYLQVSAQLSNNFDTQLIERLKTKGWFDG